MPMKEDVITRQESIAGMLPNLDCGACGYRSCNQFADFVVTHPEELKRCVHLNGNEPKVRESICSSCNPQAMGEKMNWKDNLKRDFDFILDCFENEPGPKETILPYNPVLVG